jgi:hypothetical protein
MIFEQNCHKSLGLSWSVEIQASPILRTRNPFATQRSGGVNHNIGFAASGPIYLPKLYNW